MIFGNIKDLQAYLPYDVWKYVSKYNFTVLPDTGIKSMNYIGRMYIQNNELTMDKNEFIEVFVITKSKWEDNKSESSKRSFCHTN